MEEFAEDGFKYGTEIMKVVHIRQCPHLAVIEIDQYYLASVP